MRNVFGVFAKNGARAAIAVAFLAATTGPALAATTISSSATDVKIDLSLLNLLSPSLTLNSVSGTTGANNTAYNTTSPLAAVNQTLGLGFLLGQGVTTGIGSSTVSSNGTTTGSANATINSLNLNLLALVTSSLSLSSGVISSTTTYDGMNLVGTSSIANLSLGSDTVANLGINANALVSTAANRTLVDIAGLKITLNEQLSANSLQNNIYTQSLTTNALHIAYNDFAFGGSLLTGNVIVGQSQVTVSQAVPEPATWAMMIVGFGMVGGALRRQQRVVRALA